MYIFGLINKGEFALFTKILFFNSLGTSGITFGGAAATPFGGTGTVKKLDKHF